jgi:uncharacterized protein (UPF0261 family)
VEEEGMGNNVVLLGTFDTKGVEFLYVKGLLEKNKDKVLTIDVGTGVRGELIFAPDYPREEVVKKVGSSMDEIVSLGQKWQEARIIEIMADGALVICRELLDAGKMDGLLSLGGSVGTNMGTRVMRGLPFGLPKVMVSTIASSDTSPYVGTKDIVMIPSVADIAGLNRITETSLANGAGAVMGMMSVEKPKASKKPVISVTTLGATTPCALAVKKRLEEKGYEMVVFHANGMGGQSMEEMIGEGLIQGVFDLSTNEVVDNLYGGWGNAGPRRLEAAGVMGIPQLVAPGNIDHIIYSSKGQIPERFQQQHIHYHGPNILVLRTKKNEMIEVAKVMAEKINRAKGKVAVILPLRGLSPLDKVDKEFDNPEADLAYFDTLKAALRPDVEVRGVNAHISDAVFAEEAATMLYELLTE